MFEMDEGAGANGVNSELPAELDELFDDHRPTTSADPPTGNGSQTPLDAPPPGSQGPPPQQPAPVHSQPPYRGPPQPGYQDTGPPPGPGSYHNASVSVTSTPIHPGAYPPSSAGYHPGPHHPGSMPPQNNSVLQVLLRNNSSGPEMNGPRSVGAPPGAATPSPQRPPTGPPQQFHRSPASVGMGSPPGPPPNPSRHNSGPGGRPPDGGFPPPPVSSMPSPYSGVSQAPPPGNVFTTAGGPVSQSLSGMQPRMMGPGPRMNGPRGPRGQAPLHPMNMGGEPMPPMGRGMPQRMPMNYGGPPGHGDGPGGHGGPGQMPYSNGGMPMRHPPPDYLPVRGVSQQKGGPPQGGPMQGPPGGYRPTPPHLSGPPAPPFSSPMSMPSGGVSSAGSALGLDSVAGGSHAPSGPGSAFPDPQGPPGQNLLGGGGGPPGTPGGGPQQDPEKRKLIQQQLVLLLHAHKCQQRERDAANGQRNECNLPHCNTMKGVLAHMTSCSMGRQCTYPHCASSRQIIQHWKNCNRNDCPVCLPLKAIASDGSRSAGDNSMLQIISGEGRPTPPNQGPHPPVLNGQATRHLNPAAAALNAGFPGGAGSGPPPPNVNVIGTPANGPRPPSGGPIANQLPPPENAETVKHWHRQVTSDLRNHLVGKLVKAIFPSPDPSAIHDQRIRDLIQYARKVEKDMFEYANDREEYYHLLAEKIYKIQKELQDKKQKREQMNQRGGLPGQAGPSGLVSSALKDIDMTAPPNRVAPGMNAQGNGGPPPSFPGLPSSSKQEDIKPDLSVIRAEISAAGERGGLPPSTLKEELKKEEPEDEPGKGSGTSASATTTPRPKVKTPPPPKVAVKDKEFPPTQLRTYLCSVWDKLESLEEAIPFRVPVDPELLQIPDYFDIIKHPMDLSTIKEKINNGEYRNPWAFCDDIWQMFENAWVYNKKNSKVYKFCNKMSEHFVSWMDPVMRELGFCCGRRMAFTPLPIFCYGKPMCAIPRDHEYYSYNASSSQYGVVVSDQYQYCLKCFEAMPEVINLGDDPGSNKMVPKTEFKRCKNDQVEFEPFIHCQYCGRKWHNICALYNDKVNSGGFSCASCLQERKQARPEVKTTAKRLAHCKLSRHIESRVMRYLDERVKDGCMARKDLHEVHIRVLATADREVELKPLMKQRFAQPSSSPRLPERSPYRTKAVFAFQNINGNEVCFFGLYVQEYGTKAAPCNQRRVYIAYLDSVHYYEPRSERTNVYHQILLGYLEYVKTLGFTIAHLWACPPSEGDDYIFHCHPPEQKIPRQNRLKEWYKKMLDKGVVDRIVMDYRDILRDAQQDQITTPADLPYFEGDFWPSVFEDCIREFNKEEDERRRMEEAEVDDTDGPEGPEGSAGPGATDKAAGKSKKGKGQKRKGGHSKKGTAKKSKKGVTGNELMDKILVHMEKHKEVFFVIRLISVQQASTLGPIEDPDSLIQSDLMDVRDNFLNRAREEHWEFSSKRRATYSTMCLTHALHTQGRELESYSCNNCSKTTASMHCPTCDDFDLCAICYQKVTHEHKMEKITSLVQNDSDDSRTDSKDQNGRNESIQRCIQSLVHACQCREANCRRLSCHKMKRVVQHTQQCKKRQAGHCPVCKQLIALCCYHAKHCMEVQCQVPFCQNIRAKLEEQRKAQRRQQDRMMQRRMQGMYQMNLNNAAAAAAVPGSAPSPAGMSHANSVPGHAPPPHALQQQHSLGAQYGQQSPLLSGDNPGAMAAAQNAQRIAFQQRAGPVPASPGPRMPQQGYRMPMGPGGPMPPRGPPMQGQLGMDSQRSASMPGGPPPGQPMRGGRPGARGPMDPKVLDILTKLKTARNKEEENMIVNELHKDPQLMANFIAVKRDLQQERSSGGQTIATGGPMRGPTNPAWAGQRPPNPQQQNFYQQQGGGPRPPAYAGQAPFQGPPPGGYMGPGGSPGLLGQVRSPQTGAGTPTGSLRSPSAGASPALLGQGSLPPQLDPPPSADFR